MKGLKPGMAALVVTAACVAGCGSSGHTPGPAACAWHTQNPGPAVQEDLYGVSFPDTTHGWVVGGLDKPVIRATSDGGVTWRAQHFQSSDGLSAVSFVDDTHGWAVGGGNLVISTADGGTSWHPENAAIGGSGNLYGVDFVDRAHGWIVGSQGVVEATSDGGLVWRAQRSGIHADLRQVQFTDPLHGWILAQNGELLRTLDGGASWTPVPAAAGKNNSGFVALAVLDPQHLWLAGSVDTSENNYGAINRTGDGSRSWRQSVAQNYDDERFGPVAFTDPKHGWVASPLDGDLWYSDDSGQDWGSRPSPTANEIYDMVFRDASHGWAVAADDTILACTSPG